MNIIIVEKNLYLEPTSELQASQLFTAIDNNRIQLSGFLPWVDNMRTVEDLKEYLKNAGILCQQEKEASFAIIFNKVAVGRIGLHHLNMQNKIGAIGYWLGKEAQGKGLILKSCKALINHGFQNLGLHRIEIKAAVNNLKSQAIPVKLNFVKEGLLRQAEFVNNQFLDLFLYSMLSNEWQATNR
jgi:ribosomal-protein-serine acetyltransferase